MAQLSELIPDEDKWFEPFDNVPEFKIKLLSVDARKLDVLLNASQVRVKSTDGRGRSVEEKIISSFRTAKVYSKEVFVDFKGLDEKKGTPLENTEENRVMLLTKMNDLLNFVIETAHNSASFIEAQLHKETEDFLESSEAS